MQAAISWSGSGSMRLLKIIRTSRRLGKGRGVISKELNRKILSRGNLIHRRNIFYQSCRKKLTQEDSFSAKNIPSIWVVSSKELSSRHKWAFWHAPTPMENSAYGDWLARIYSQSKTFQLDSIKSAQLQSTSLAPGWLWASNNSDS